jgi:6-phosphofructokinase 1
MGYASSVDLDEAYRVGQKAAELAASGESGYMATILRDAPASGVASAPRAQASRGRKPPDNTASPTTSLYCVRYDKVPLEQVANSERAFPKHWIAESGYDVTDDFLRYARPLIGEDMITLPLVDGRLRMTRFEATYAAQKLAKYVSQADRK